MGELKMTLVETVDAPRDVTWRPSLQLAKLIIAEKQLESKLPIIAKKRLIFEMLKKQNLIII